MKRKEKKKAPSLSEFAKELQEMNAKREKRNRPWNLGLYGLMAMAGAVIVLQIIEGDCSPIVHIGTLCWIGVVYVQTRVIKLEAKIGRHYLDIMSELFTDIDKALGIKPGKATLQEKKKRGRPRGSQNGNKK